MRAFLPLLALLCLTGPMRAQTKAPIGCAQAVQMGFDKFRNAEIARTGDESTAGMVAISDRYTKCKREANNRAIKVLSPSQQKQVATARRELDNLESALWTMVYVRAGGGTMYSQFAAAASAEREDIAGDFINQLRATKKASRRAIKVLWMQSERKLAPHFKTPAKLEGNVFGSASEDRKRYAKASREAQSALKALKVLCERVPSGAAKILAQRVAYAASHNFETV